MPNHVLSPLLFTPVTSVNPLNGPGLVFFSLTFRAAFEIVALAAARLGTIPRAAQSVIMTTDQSSLPSLNPHFQRPSPPDVRIFYFIVLNSIPFGIGMALTSKDCCIQYWHLAYLRPPRRCRRVHTSGKRHRPARCSWGQVHWTPLGIAERNNRSNRHGRATPRQRCTSILPFPTTPNPNPTKTGIWVYLQR